MDKQLDHWNELIKIRDDLKVAHEIKNYASLLLNQLNTASGSRVKPEIEQFLNQFNNV